MVTQLLQHWSKHRHLFHTLSHQAWFNLVQNLISDEQRSICCQLQLSRPPLENKLLPFEFTISVAKYMDHLYIIHVQIYNSGILLHSLETANKHNHHSKSPLHQGTKSRSNLSQLTHQPLQTATSHKGMHTAKPSSAFFLNTMQYSHLLLKRSTTSTEDYPAHRGLLHPCLPKLCHRHSKLPLLHNQDTHSNGHSRKDHNYSLEASSVPDHRHDFSSLVQGQWKVYVYL